MSVKYSTAIKGKWEQMYDENKMLKHQLAECRALLSVKEDHCSWLAGMVENWSDEEITTHSHYINQTSGTEALEEMKMTNERQTCKWAQDMDGAWETECGHLFEITEGTPNDNYMKYCCYCGKLIEQSEFEWEAEEME